MLQREVHQLLRKREKQAWNPIDVLTCVLGPLALYAYLSYIVGFHVRYHLPRFTLIVGPVFGSMLCYMMTRRASRRMGAQEPARPHLTLAWNLWWALALGCLAGDTIFRWHTFSYYSYQDMASYTNIDPNSDKGQTYMDAGQVYFKESSYVMTTKAVAFESAGIYCVAPIVRWPPQTHDGVDKARIRRAGCSTECSPPACMAGNYTDGGSLLTKMTSGAGLEVCSLFCSPRNGTTPRHCGQGPLYEMGDSVDCSGCVQAVSMPAEEASNGYQFPSSGTVDFWAVGKDCCEPSGADFQCGAALSTKARAGLRMLRDDIRPFYLMAVQEWSAWIGQPSKHPLFFHWVEDPIAEVDAHLSSAENEYTVFLSLFTVLVIFFTLAVLYALLYAGFP